MSGGDAELVKQGYAASHSELPELHAHHVLGTMGTATYVGNPRVVIEGTLRWGGPFFTHCSGFPLLRATAYQSSKRRGQNQSGGGAVRSSTKPHVFPPRPVAEASPPRRALGGRRVPPSQWHADSEADLAKSCPHPGGTRVAIFARLRGQTMTTGDQVSLSPVTRTPNARTSAPGPRL